MLRWLRRLRDRRRHDATARQQALAWLRDAHPKETARTTSIRARQPGRTVVAIFLQAPLPFRGVPPHRLVAIDDEGVIELPNDGLSPYAPLFR